MESISGTLIAGDLKCKFKGSLQQQGINGSLQWRGSVLPKNASEIIPSSPKNIVRLELDDSRSGDFRITGICFTSDGRREYFVAGQLG
jgi:hypothetical protein